MTYKNSTDKNSANKAQKIGAYIASVALVTLPVILSAATKFTNPIAAKSLDGFLVEILNVVILIGAIVVVFFLILAGFKYVTARGDEKQIASAHSMFLGTVIGGAIVLGARVIASAIKATVDQLGI
ncbi:MAG: hypothetical protein KBB54_03240 [Candidatus Pacebacteria bacterium]|nr:hypothetical protein [Candidatus Paceibacterota bacterium]MBP9818918.1 hypothetical protein [Candidatus Paceibacterota bacterium]